MKKLVNLFQKSFWQLAVLLCLLNFFSFAQVNTDKTPPAPQPPGGYPFLVERDEKMTISAYKERIFGALDLSQVPTGRLMEYTLIGWDTTRFTRSSPNDSVLNYGHWLQCYGQLKAAEVNTQSNLLHPDELPLLPQTRTKKTVFKVLSKNLKNIFTSTQRIPHFLRIVFNCENKS